MDPFTIWQWLDRQELVVGWQTDIVVVHGDAPGGDQIGKLWALLNGHEHEAHPANWSAPCRHTCNPGHRKQRKNGSTYCPAAGIYRNQEMVDLGATVCGAFILNGSPGTTQCAKAAQAAGIPTERHYAHSL